jgi:hypothetical protein
MQKLPLLRTKVQIVKFILLGIQFHEFFWFGFFFFLAVLRFELRASHSLGRSSNTWATPSALRISLGQVFYKQFHRKLSTLPDNILEISDTVLVSGSISFPLGIFGILSSSLVFWNFSYFFFCVCVWFYFQFLFSVLFSPGKLFCTINFIFFFSVLSVIIS